MTRHVNAEGAECPEDMDAGAMAQPALATRSDMARQLREHYERISMAACDWHSGIPRLIDEWEKAGDPAPPDATLDGLLRDYAEKYGGYHTTPKEIDEAIAAIHAYVAQREAALREALRGLVNVVDGVEFLAAVDLAKAAFTEPQEGA